MTPATGMPGTTGTIRHPDVSEISDLTEGLLSPSRTAEIRRHLGDCPLCADVRASLEEIRSLLGTLPGPARMPADIAGRIDAALAAEALLDSTSPRTRPASAPRPRPTEGDVSRETPPAATGKHPQPSAAGGSGVHRPSGHPTGPSGPGRRRARRRIAVLTGLAGAAACALGIFLFSDLSGTSDRPTARSEAASSAARPSAEAGAYTAQGLQKNVQQLLDSQKLAGTDSGQQNNTYGMENTPPAQGVAPGDLRVGTVPACVQAATGRSEAPLATERGRYQGTAVYLLVLPHPGDSSRVDAYLVDAGCENEASGAPGKPLLTSTHPRS
ncbi:anti-sigma factor family protein [Streptomyces sp. NPDC059989]|uniref:anti-sigma factor family protein n=1 Tax=Streptomyces sp. NPDC059989 TaxID=3347026 RepID=UPI0036B3DD12